MKVVEEPRALPPIARAAHGAGGSVALVPTMGALHDGHLSLLAAARDAHEVVVLSIFVNPLQFDDPGDLERYPVERDVDLELAAKAGVDVCFVPAREAMYPDGRPLVHVDAGALGAPLEGAARPGHFDGVATVVTKLLALASPDAAYFGEKDYQQLVIVRRLVADLSLPTTIVACPTVREPDGLALSSRNRRLSNAERRAAPVLQRALVVGRDAVGARASRPEVESAMLRALGAEPLVIPDYAVVTDPLLGLPPTPLAGALRLLVAAQVGSVRLIDNLEASA